jgi:RimJ/RimL family protein N-acetyltransferase
MVQTFFKKDCYRIAGKSDLDMLESELNEHDWLRLAGWLQLSCTKLSWVVLDLARGALTEALVLLTHPAYGIPLELVRLPGRTPGAPIDGRLLRSGIDCARKHGAKELFYSISGDFSEREVIGDFGFSRWREILCFTSAGHIVCGVNDYRIVEAGMFSEAEILALIEHTSESCGDSQTKHFRHLLGSYDDAKLTLETMELAAHDPCWWLVALGPGGRRIGIVLPVLEYGKLTIGFIGVAPEFRGRGIAPCLLNQLRPLVHRSGYSSIYAEVDSRNGPMQRTVAKSGFRLESVKQEWRLTMES